MLSQVFDDIACGQHHCAACRRLAPAYCTSCAPPGSKSGQPSTGRRRWRASRSRAVCITERTWASTSSTSGFVDVAVRRQHTAGMVGHHQSAADRREGFQAAHLRPEPSRDNWRHHVDHPPGEGGIPLGDLRIFGFVAAHGCPHTCVWNGCDCLSLASATRID